MINKRVDQFQRFKPSKFLTLPWSAYERKFSLQSIKDVFTDHHPRLHLSDICRLSGKYTRPPSGSDVSLDVIVILFMNVSLTHGPIHFLNSYKRSNVEDYNSYIEPIIKTT